jgi:hypothetical protein
LFIAWAKAHQSLSKLLLELFISSLERASSEHGASQHTGSRKRELF